MTSGPNVFVVVVRTAPHAFLQAHCFLGRKEAKLNGLSSWISLSDKHLTATQNCTHQQLLCTAVSQCFRTIEAAFGRTGRPVESTLRSVQLPYGPPCQGPGSTALPSHGPLCTCQSHLLLLRWLWPSLAPYSTLSSHSKTGPAQPQQTRLHF